MTVSLIGSPRRTSEEARLDKNRRIKESIKETKAKRKTQTCSTFDLKIVGNKLSSTQREALVRVFLEAKWLWNECIASGDPFSYKPRKNVLVKTKDDTMDEREYRVLGSQMKQSLVKTIRSNIKTLATLKKQGRKTGTVGFTSEVKSLGLPQPETTYRIRGQKARIQNIPGWVRVRGVGQLEGWEQAKAVLTSEADGWHLHVTCYMDKEEHRKRREAKRLAPVKNTIIGLDMGVKTAITCSDGTEYDVMVGETDRLKREQRKLNRKKKGSNNRQRNRMRIRRAYTKQQNRLNDAANKTAAELLRNETIFMQDEQVKAWHRRPRPRQKQTDPPRGTGGGALQVGADHATVPCLRDENQNPAGTAHIQVRRLWLYGPKRRQSRSDHGLAWTIRIFGQNTLGTRGIQACGERIGVIRGQSAYVLHAFGEAGNRDGFSLTVVHNLLFSLRIDGLVSSWADSNFSAASL